MRKRSGAVRLAGPDESFMIVERYAGIETPIQLGWVLPVDPGADCVRALHSRLVGSSIDRRVVRTRIPFARHRWVAADPGSTPRLDSVPVPDSNFSEWFTAHLDGTSVRPTEGRSWHVASAPTVSGGRVVSLLSSHMVTDGNGLRLEVIGVRRGVVAGAPAGALATLIGDVGDAIGQVGAAAVAFVRLVAVLVAMLLPGRRESAGPYVVDLGPDPEPGAVRRVVAPSSIPDDDRPVQHLLCDVDRSAFRARAAERGGTTNSLFCALFGAIAQRADIPDGDETAICIAVNRRGETDDRANASGGVWIRLRGRIGPHVDLSGVRAQTKKALSDYAARGDQMSADNIQPIVRLLPGRVVLSLMKSIPAPHTTVSNLGQIPDELLVLGGVRATTHFTRAALRGLDAPQRRSHGKPGLLAWMNEYDDTVTLAVCGIDPDRFDSAETLRRLVADELTAWDIPHAIR